MKKLYLQINQKTAKDNKPSIKVEVELAERKVNVYGRTLCRITPVKGYGTIWVNESSLLVL
jgi:hypothetical protein